LLPKALGSAYRDASLEAVAETGLPRSGCPEARPWTIEQVLDGAFRPGDCVLSDRMKVRMKLKRR
jgi:hypothetical protein